jgi:hypothetical protein
MEAKAELLPYLDDSALPPGPPAGLSVIQRKPKPDCVPGAKLVQPVGTKFCLSPSTEHLRGELPNKLNHISLKKMIPVRTTTINS